MSKKMNQTTAAEQIKAGIESNNQDAIREALEFLNQQKRLKEVATLAMDAATKFLDFAGDDEEAKVYSMAQQLAEARKRYVKATAASGNATMHNDDPIARALSSLDHTQTCQLADQLLGLHPGTKKRPGEKTHEEQYAGLNNGQKRMNAGNRIRAAWKNGDESVMAWLK